MRRSLALGTTAVIAFAALTTSSAAHVRRTPDGWVGTSAAAPSAGVAETPDGYPNFSIRNVVHTSVGGNAAPVRLSNAFGTTPVTFASVTVAVAAAPGGPRAVPGSMRTLTFGGSPTVVVPAGAEVLSDPA